MLGDGYLYNNKYIGIRITIKIRDQTGNQYCKNCEQDVQRSGSVERVARHSNCPGIREEADDFVGDGFGLVRVVWRSRSRGRDQSAPEEQLYRAKRRIRGNGL